MTAAGQELSKAAVAATDGRRQSGRDSSNGESSKGESSKGESPKGESSQGESSKGASWLRLGKGRGEARGTRRSLFSLYQESFYEESESEAAFEMEPLTLHIGDKEKSDDKGKKKADKGKAVYRDPWVAHSQGVRVEKKRREVEPKKDEGDASDLSSALAKLRLDCDEYQEEREKEQKKKQKQKQKQKLEQAKRRRARPSPYHEAEDGWMVVREDLDVWDFSEEVGHVLPE
ncbi:uncharacterized protein TrAtP1_000173 [Trichoderma atroviride]|uniref:uncharacterized protein n=1 Tax=Hypocrea atroviridis TaxID=63577 RepID=UPI0033260DE0|nr:hypothetical protein TrAtP1_000173 [Trichoderma atroviride]